MLDPESNMNDAPLAGFGYGLPLSRLYARYLGGDLSVISVSEQIWGLVCVSFLLNGLFKKVENYGTDAYVYLRKLSSEANEDLPMWQPISRRHQ